MTFFGVPAPRAGQLLPACLIILSMLMPSLSTAEVYKWVDSSGKTNYTQLPPPPGFESEVVREAPAPRATSAPSATETRKRFEEKQRDSENDAALAELDKKNTEIRKLNCDAATGNRAALEKEGQRRYMNADGELVRPTDEERKKLVDQAKQQMKKYCTE